MPTSFPVLDGAHASASALTLAYCGGREPAFIAAVAFSVGIIAGSLWWPAPHAWLTACIVAVVGVLVLYWRAPSLAFPLAILALVPLGVLYLQVLDAAQTTSPNLEAFVTGEGTVDITAHVVREGIARDSPYGGKQESVDVETEQLSAGDHVLNALVGIRLTIFSKRAEEEEARDAGADSALLVYTYGERLHFPAKLRAPRNYGNPGALDLSGRST